MEADPATDRCFAALAHPARRRMLDLLVQSPGMNVKGLASHFPFSRVAALKHLGVLEEAGLVLSERDGRSRRLYFNPVPIQQIHDRWTTQLSAFWAGRMADVQARVEAGAEQRRDDIA